MANALSAVVVVIITIFIPPLGVFLIAGCGADLLINICLTLLGYFPGHIHAFYLEYVYYDREGQGALRRHGSTTARPGGLQPKYTDRGPYELRNCACAVSPTKRMDRWSARGIERDWEAEGEGDGLECLIPL
ncbi:hypothetical protein ABVK25_005499 [Lepraria finkii]|uniref:Plasma membrane proteolipid 3 n=1 Tax=Lepraria finkii TaxID=1340010 RepID=A0ABR4B921_9LECA